MAFELYKGSKTRDTKNSNDARFKIRKDGSGVLCFSNAGIYKIKELGLPYAIGDKVELHIDKDSGAVAFKQGDSDFSLNLSRYGRADSKLFQIYSKGLATGGSLVEGDYKIEEPRKSESEYDFIIYPVKEV